MSQSYDEWEADRKRREGNLARLAMFPPALRSFRVKTGPVKVINVIRGVMKRSVIECVRKGHQPTFYRMMQDGNYTCNHCGMTVFEAVDKDGDGY